MIASVRLEFLKLWTTRLWLGLLAPADGLTVLVAVIESARSGSGGAVPSLTTAAGQRDILTTTGFGILVAAVFGTTVVTGEFRHRTITDTSPEHAVAGRGGAPLPRSCPPRPAADHAPEGHMTPHPPYFFLDSWALVIIGSVIFILARGRRRKRQSGAGPAGTGGQPSSRGNGSSDRAKSRR